MPQSDLYLELGNDFVITNNGDLQLASGWDLIRQNFERFVFTQPQSTDFRGNPVPADWIFEPNFGLGAGSLLGENYNQNTLNKLQQSVYQGALTASTGNSNTPPVVTVTSPNSQEVVANVVITPSGGQSQTLQVNLP
jgi:hypothetical protein